MFRPGVLTVLILGLLTACGPADPKEEGSSIADVSISIPGSTDELAAQVNPTSLAFGQQRVGTSATQTVVVRNTGSTVITVSSVSISGSSSFSTPSTAPFSLAPASSRTLLVSFNPTIMGSVTGTLTLTTNDPTSPNVSIALLGTGVKPILAFEPGQLLFANQNVGTTSAPMSVTLRNTGTGPITLTSLSLSAPFSVASPVMPFTLAASQSMQLSLVFSPTAEGVFSGTLQILTNDPEYSSVQVALMGAGVRPNLVVNVSALDFGEVRVGTSASMVISVANTGTAPATVSSLSLVGSGASAFTLVSPTVPFTLAIGDTRQLPVSFNPTVEAVFDGALVLTTADSSIPPLTVALRGVGVRPILVVSPASVDFGEQPVGTTATRSVTISNVGTGSLHVSSVAVSAPFIVTPATPFTLYSGESRVITVGFGPVQQGPVTGTLTLSTNDAALPVVSIPLSGVGVGAGGGLVFDPASLDFGARQVGTSSTRVVTLTNAGFSALFLTSLSLTADVYPSFSSTTLPAIPFYLAPGSSVQFLVSFNPSTVGAVTGTLRLTTNDPASIATLPLSGSGVGSLIGEY